jgi:excisionase family DNA binding protein
MPGIKKKPVQKTKAKSNNGTPPNDVEPIVGSDVMTLAEAAAFLRVSETDVAQSAEAHEIPARRIGGEWRFWKSAVVEWLAAKTMQPAKSDFWTTQTGAFKDDPSLDQMVREIYARRGRPMTEDV